MRLLICAGGTGGGVYPALAVLQALNAHNPEWQEGGALLWVGGEGGMEGEIISRQRIDFQAIPAAGLHGVGLRRLPGNLIQLLRGYLEAKRIIRNFKPDVLFFTGGYLAVPVALAGMSIPSLVYVPDIEPGLAIRTISRLASLVAISVESRLTISPRGKDLLVTGYPVRSNMREWDRQKALDVLELSSDLPVLLVFGGSKGARSINQALMPILPELLQDMQVVHITGKRDWEEMNSVHDQLTTAEQRNYRSFPFLHERMGAALRAADLVVSRSGASILGEYTLFELPAILVPYPYAWRYQKTNARYLADRGAAVIINDEDLADELLPRVRSLISDPDCLKGMRMVLRGLAKPEAAQTIAQELVRLAGMRERRDSA